MLQPRLNHQTNSGVLLVKPALNLPNGPWITLLEKTYSLFDSITSDGFTIPRWSLGGGIVATEQPLVTYLTLPW
jgi:hypothetical protein